MLRSNAVGSSAHQFLSAGVKNPLKELWFDPSGRETVVSFGFFGRSSGICTWPSFGKRFVG